MKILAVVSLSSLLAGQAMAWELNKQQNSASTHEVVDGFVLKFECRRGSDKLGFQLSDLTLAGRGMQGEEALMIRIALPDNRTERWSFIAQQEGPALTGEIVVSSQTLDNFGNGIQLSLSNPMTRKLWLETQMNGTGAARLAFRERCGL